MTKPSLDGIGSWLEGRLTKFIAGEGEDSPATTAHPGVSQGAHGPFSHYSTISSAAPSTAPSPQPSIVNPYTLSNVTQQPPRRSGSAMAVRPAAQAPVDRASSAMDIRHRASPVARSATSAVTASFQGTPGYGSPYSPYSPALGTSINTAPHTLATQGNGERETDPNQPWWGGSGESASATPTAPNFMRVGDDSPAESGSGFVSLMDEPTNFAARQTVAHQAPQHSAPSGQDEDEEDLGFGNSSHRKKASSSEADKPAATPEEKPKEAPKESKPSAGEHLALSA